MGRTKIGDNQGKKVRQNSFSQRAAKGLLEVIEKTCPYCNHHKALKNQTFIKCTRCKRRIN